MPLDEREQRILDEIERQFREEDPELVEAVNTMPLKRLAKGGVRVAAAGVVLGLVLMLATFSFNPVLALIGFVVMVYSVTRLVHGFGEKSRKGGTGGSEQQPSENIGDRLRRIWPFRR
jgi:hypothetical protein